MSKLNESIKSAFKSGGDVVKASKILEDMAKTDPELFCELTTYYLRQACYESIRRHCKALRKIVWTMPNHDKTQQSSKVRVLRHANMLMDFPLPGGIRIADADRADLLKAAEFYRKQIEGMKPKYKWLLMVADKLSGNQVVRKVMTEKQLRELQEMARTEYASVSNA